MDDETIQGRSVTDEDIERWSSEADQGYPVERLRKRGRPTVGDGAGEVISVRLDRPLLDALARRSRREGVDRSQAIREAVRAWSDA